MITLGMITVHPQDKKVILNIPVDGVLLEIELSPEEVGALRGVIRRGIEVLKLRSSKE